METLEIEMPSLKKGTSRNKKTRTYRNFTEKDFQQLSAHANQKSLEYWGSDEDYKEFINAKEIN